MGARALNVHVEMRQAQSVLTTSGDVQSAVAYAVQVQSEHLATGTLRVLNGVTSVQRCPTLLWRHAAGRCIGSLELRSTAFLGAEDSPQLWWIRLGTDGVPSIMHGSV